MVGVSANVAGTGELTITPKAIMQETKVVEILVDIFVNCKSFLIGLDLIEKITTNRFDRIFLEFV